MAVVFAEGFETATKYPDLTARGTQANAFFVSAGTKYTTTSNGSGGISANGGTAIAACGASTTSTAYSQFLVTSPSTVNLNSANGVITLAARLYYDPNAVVNPTIGLGNVVTDGTYYWMAHGNSTSADMTLLAGMTTTGASSSAPVRHNPFAGTLPNSNSAFIFDAIYYSGYYYVLAGSGTTLYLSQYSALTGAVAPLASATFTMTSFTSLVSNFTLGICNGYVIACGTDANSTGRYCSFSINGTTGAPTAVSLSSPSTTNSNSNNQITSLPSSIGTWTAGNTFTPASTGSVMAYWTANGTTWTALTTTVPSTPSVVGSASCATNGSVLVFGSLVVGTTASFYTMNLSNNTWTTVKVATDTYSSTAAMHVVYGAGMFFALRRYWTGGVGWTSTDGINWTPVNLPPITTNAAQAPVKLTYRGGFFWLHLGTSSGVVSMMFSSDAVNWTPVSYYITSSSYHLGLYSMFGQVAGFTNANTAQYITGTTTANTIALTSPSQGWHMYEYSMTKTSATGYTSNWYIDAIPQASQTATYATWPQYQPISGTLSMISSTNPAAYSPTLDLIVALTSTTINICSGTKNASGIVWTTVGPTLTTPKLVKWVRNQFIVVTASTWYSSTNGVTWTAMTGVPSSTVISDLYDNGSLCLAMTLDTTAYYTSPDLVTWTTRALPSSGYTACYCAGQWVVVNAANTTGLYSSDGINWTSFTAVLNQGGNMVTDGVSKVVYFGGSSTIVTLTVTGSGAPTYSTAATGKTAGGGTFSWNSSGYVGQLSCTNGNFACTFPAGGSSWTITTLNATSSNPGTVSVNGNAVALLNNNSPSWIADLGSTQWRIHSVGALAIDDVVIVDNNTPLNMKIPLGSVRIAKNSTNSNVQAQWNPTPSGDANYVAASLIPLSSSTSQYVSTGVVGNKDIYQTAITAPQGYKAVAVATEAFASGLLTDTPQVQVGIIANSVESDASAVPIVVTGTNNQFLQQIHNTDPSSNAWTNTSSASPELTITKTA